MRPACISERVVNADSSVIRFRNCCVSSWAIAGRPDRAQSLLDGLAGSDKVSLIRVEIAALMDDEEAVLQALERAAAENPSSLLQMRCLPELRALAGHARYESVFERVGFPR